MAAPTFIMKDGKMRVSLAPFTGDPYMYINDDTHQCCGRFPCWSCTAAQLPAHTYIGFIKDNRLVDVVPVTLNGFGPCWPAPTACAYVSDCDIAHRLSWNYLTQTWVFGHWDANTGDSLLGGVIVPAGLCDVSGAYTIDFDPADPRYGHWSVVISTTLVPTFWPELYYTGTGCLVGQEFIVKLTFLDDPPLYPYVFGTNTGSMRTTTCEGIPYCVAVAYGLSPFYSPMRLTGWNTESPFDLWPFTNPPFYIKHLWWETTAPSGNFSGGNWHAQIQVTALWFGGMGYDFIILDTRNDPVLGVPHPLGTDPCAPSATVIGYATATRAAPPPVNLKYQLEITAAP